MLITRPNIQIVSREITLESGERAIAYFAIREIYGVLEYKFLGAKILKQAPEAKVLLLDNPREVIFGQTPIRTIYEFFSPFYTLDFLINQLARAPSVK
ncbi:MAG TPA: hypothetical protein VJH25_00825 [Candidatus Paceibacterota bacterium]